MDDLLVIHHKENLFILSILNKCIYKRKKSLYSADYPHFLFLLQDISLNRIMCPGGLGTSCNHGGSWFESHSCLVLVSDARLQ